MSENDMASDARTWKRCATCKKPIALGSRYWRCSVSTCNRKRTALAFCSVECWDAHVPVLRHRDAWAEEARAPAERDPESPPRRRLVVGAGGATEVKGPRRRDPPPDPEVAAEARRRPLGDPPPDEVLVVASKVKAYIKARGGLNTSAAVMQVLSDRIRAVCDEAIRSAWAHERKTVLDRDVP